MELHVKILEERALKNGTLETVVGGQMARSVEKAFHLADQWQCEESKDLALPRRSSSHQGAVARARPLGGHGVVRDQEFDAVSSAAAVRRDQDPHYLLQNAKTCLTHFVCIQIFQLLSNLSNLHQAEVSKRPQ